MTRTVRTALAALLATAVALTTVALTAPQVGAIAIAPFTVGYHTQINGGITFAQNSSLTCTSVRDTGATDAAGCTAARAASGTLTNNNNWIMGYVDVDGDPTTFNSSSSQLVLPAGAQVQHAALYWGARRKGANGKPNVSVPFDRVQLQAPGAPGYVEVVADRVIAPPASKYSDLPYQATADVTALVQSAGAGTYTVADLAAALGSDRYAGWTLAVVYVDPRKPLRDITLFEGLTVIQQGSPQDTITVSGFTAPVAGPVDATVGLVAYDGDRASTGDKASLNGVPLGSDVSPANNYFNSTVDTFGTYVETRDPSYRNNLGYDVKVASATGIIPNSATSAQVAVSTSGETVYVGLITTRIDLTAPRFPTIKSVTNLSNNDPAQVGDVLEYRLELTNVGDDPADQVVLSDPIPTGTTYVAGSLAIDGVTVSDAAGDDAGELATDRVVARVGTGASAVAGGRIDIDATTVVTFRVTTTAGSAGTTVSNVGALSYRAVTLGEVVQMPTNTVDTPVQAADLIPDPPSAPSLTIEKVAPESVPAGDSIGYDIVVRNDGTADATSVVLTDPMPFGVTATAATSPCTIVADQVSCALGTLVAGDSVTVHIDGAVAGSTPGGTVLDNTASVAATGLAAVTATASTRVPATPDVSLVKSVVGTLTAGATGTYRFTVTNDGQAPASDVVVSDPLPAGLTPAPGGPCTVDPETATLLLCPIGDLAAGSTVVIDVDVLIDASLAGTVVNGATVSAAGVEVTPGDNTSQVTTDVEASGGGTTTTVPSTTTPVLPATGGRSQAPLAWAFGLLAVGLCLEAVRRRRPT